MKDENDDLLENSHKNFDQVEELLVSLLLLLLFIYFILQGIQIQSENHRL
jgi:hypothetical protein